jgi:lipid-A-disaccharide synthase
MESPRKVVLFTAQEPSGDAHAAPVIARLREAYPDIEPVAFGGPRMEAAGARMLGRTADDGVMGVAGITKVFEVRALHNRIVEWVRANPTAVHVPVDSPSANLPLCARLKPMGVRIVNLVAPQLWAWAPWRIGKVRRISDVLLCLLPFEEEWFRSRGVTAKFVGHPVLAAPLDHAALTEEAAQIPGGAPRILILPGSRSGEVRRNARLLADAFMLVRGSIPSSSGLIVASSDANADRIRAELGGSIPYGVEMVVHRIDAGVAWCDLALAVSGTVSLDCTRQAKPVVGVYRTSWIEAFLARFILRAPHRLLPNIIAGKRIVPEFVPYSGNAEPIAEAALELLSNGVRMQRTRDDLRKVSDLFKDRDPGRIAAEVVARAARGERLGNPELDEICAHGA